MNEASAVELVEFEIKGEKTRAIAIKCQNCGKWILEQYWVRLVICPWCDRVNRVSLNPEKIRNWLKF